MGIRAYRLKGLREAWRGIASSSRTRTVDTPAERDAVVRSEVIDLASLAVIVALAALVGLAVMGPVRAVLALLFFTFVPGWAVVTNWTSAARISRVALSVLLSLAICTAVATTALWLRIWPPIALFYVTASACAVAITRSLLRRRAGATREFDEGNRMLGAIEAERGTRPRADQHAPALAAPLVDGTLPLDGEDGVLPRPSVGVGGTTTTGDLVNVNTAGTAELGTLPGIGKVIAQRIVDHRTANGPFASVGELIHVRGIGDAILESIRDLIIV